MSLCKHVHAESEFCARSWQRFNIRRNGDIAYFDFQKPCSPNGKGKFRLNSKKQHLMGLVYSIVEELPQRTRKKHCHLSTSAATGKGKLSRHIPPNFAISVAAGLLNSVLFPTSYPTPSPQYTPKPQAAKYR